MQFEQAGAATDLIREILRHIDGGLTTDPATGKLMLKLIRADYRDRRPARARRVVHRRCRVLAQLFERDGQHRPHHVHVVG
jgi:hypothetical protein